MKCSDELRQIAKDIVKMEAGGLHKSQYWGLRLRLIADELDGKKIPMSPFRPHTKGEFEAYGRFIDEYFSGG